MAKPQTGQLFAPPFCQWVGERGLRVATGKATLAYYKWLVSQKLAEVEDVITADGSLLLILCPGAEPSDALRRALAAPEPGTPPSLGGELHMIPVEFGGADGPDLPELAERAGLDEADYIRAYASAEYTVAFIGFQPGFPYLSGLPDALQAARRASPRLRVAAGSVAIGGRYAGIYPASGPGGWQIIGRTPSVLFDPLRSRPTLLMPGDRLRFVPL